MLIQYNISNDHYCRRTSSQQRIPWEESPGQSLSPPDPHLKQYRLYREYNEMNPLDSPISSRPTS